MLQKQKIKPKVGTKTLRGAKKKTGSFPEDVLYQLLQITTTTTMIIIHPAVDWRNVHAVMDQK